MKAKESSVFLNAIDRSCSFLCRWVEQVPGFNPSNHGITKFIEVRINRAKLFLDQFGKLKVALLHGRAIFWKDNRLEEWDDVFLPVYALVFLLQIHEWIARLAMPDVWQSCLHPETQMITDYLKSTHIERGLCMPIIWSIKKIKKKKNTHCIPSCVSVSSILSIKWELAQEMAVKFWFQSRQK